MALLNVLVRDPVLRLCAHTRPKKCRMQLQSREFFLRTYLEAWSLLCLRVCAPTPRRFSSRSRVGGYARVGKNRLGLSPFASLFV